MLNPGFVDPPLVPILVVYIPTNDPPLVLLLVVYIPTLFTDVNRKLELDSIHTIVAPRFQHCRVHFYHYKVIKKYVHIGNSKYNL